MTVPLSDPQSILNPTTGQSLTAAWCDNVRDNIVTLSNMPGCIVQRTTSQTISTGAGQAIAFNAADIRDTDAYHDTVTNNTRLTVPTGLGGLYWVGALVAFDPNATGYRFIFARLNGSALIAHSDAPVSSGSAGTLLTFNAPAILAAGDYVEICAEQNTGGNLNVVATYPLRGWLLQLAKS